MRLSYYSPLYAGLAALLSTVISPIGAQACTPLADAEAALNARDLEGALAASKTAETACSGGDHGQARRFAALVLFNDAAQAVGQGQTLASQEARLRQAREIAAPWQVLDALGELELSRRNFADAAWLYHLALEDALNPLKNPGGLAPPPDYLAHLGRTAEEMRLASPIAVPRGKGACSLKPKSYGVARRAEPIRFEFGSDQLQGEDLKAAEFLLACLRASEAKEVTIVGHTDDVGTREENQKLSERRAAVVAAFLRDGGYAGKIETRGEGEDIPFPVADESVYPSKKDRDRVNRRVEAVLKDY